MIVDCVTIFNEIDMLRIRLRELGDVIDKFVIVEAGETFSGQPKKFCFDLCRDIFADYADKIVYVKLPRLIPLIQDTEENRFKLETFSRNAILYGLIQVELNDHDLVLISDVDEIPSLDAIGRLKKMVVSDETKISWTFRQFFQKSYFDDALDDGYNRQWWGGTVAVKYAVFGDYSPQQIRREIGGGGRKFNVKFCDDIKSGIIDHAGWHLSSFGGPSVQKYKLANYAHGVGRVVENNKGVLMIEDEVKEILRLDVELREELDQFINENLGGYVPLLVKENPISFSHFFKRSYLDLS